MAFLVAVSIVALAFIPVLVLQPNIDQIQTLLRHCLVGGLYFTLCVLGLSAVFYPTKCKSMFQKSQNPPSQTNKPSSALPIKGHHPDCKNYFANRIIFGGRAVCAACSGLLIGDAIALFGAVLYFFVDVNLIWANVWLLVLGEALLLLGLAQIKFSGYSKVAVNALFVVGSFITLAETDLMAESLLVDLYALALIGFMLWIRILLSEWNNGRICRSCGACFL